MVDLTIAIQKGDILPVCVDSDAAMIQCGHKSEYITEPLEGWLSAKPGHENFDHSRTLPAAYRLHVSIIWQCYPLRKITGLHYPHPSGLILLNLTTANGDASAFNIDIDLISVVTL